MREDPIKSLWDGCGCLLTAIAFAILLWASSGFPAIPTP